MEVDSNIETKENGIEYLKSIDVSANNIHEEYEFDNYIVSIVMVSINSTTMNSNNEEYEIYSLCQDKKSNKIYGKFFKKAFINKKDADNYYKELRMKVKNYNDEDIKFLVQ